MVADIANTTVHSSKSACTMTLKCDYLCTQISDDSAQSSKHFIIFGTKSLNWSL